MRAIFASLLAVIFAAFGMAQAGDVPKIDKVVVEKATHTLTLYAQGKVVKTYRVAIGVGAPGQKVSAGDDRTPEGTYIIDAKTTASEFHRSLHISYPNESDRRRARDAGKQLSNLIAIHGTPDWIQRMQEVGKHPDWTAGCIAVRNAELDELYALVPTGTPVEIKP